MRICLRLHIKIAVLKVQDRCLKFWHIGFWCLFRTDVWPKNARFFSTAGCTFGLHMCLSTYAVCTKRHSSEMPKVRHNAECSHWLNDYRVMGLQCVHQSFSSVRDWLIGLDLLLTCYIHTDGYCYLFIALTPCQHETTTLAVGAAYQR